MDRLDQAAFLVALTTLGELFSDELSELRQETYWELFRDLCTLEEWEEGCRYAMRHHTFHKVPLPAQFMDYLAASLPHTGIVL